MAAATAWFVVFPASEHPGNAFPANAKVVSAQVGSPAYNAWVGNGAYTIQGTSWQVDAGPFSTEAQAKDWKPGPITVGDWVGLGIAGVLAGAGNEPNPQTSVGVGASVGTAVDSTTSAIAQFLKYPEKVLAWIGNRQNIVRVAKVVIGGTMVLVGLNMLTKNETSVTTSARQVAKTATKVVK